MAIPASITLNGCTIKINMVKNMFRDYERFGEYSSFDMCINLDADMCEQKKEIILMHEIIEAIQDLLLLTELKHDYIQPIAMGFYELLKKKQVIFE